MPAMKALELVLDFGEIELPQPQTKRPWEAADEVMPEWPSETTDLYDAIQHLPLSNVLKMASLVTRDPN